MDEWIILQTVFFSEDLFLGEPLHDDSFDRIFHDDQIFLFRGGQQIEQQLIVYLQIADIYLIGLVIATLDELK